jgi:hypothetical protein
MEARSGGTRSIERFLEFAGPRSNKRSEAWNKPTTAGYNQRRKIEMRSQWTLRGVRVAAATAALLLLGAPAACAQSAAGSAVKDDAKFFSAEAVAKVDKQLADLKQRTGVAIHVETTVLPTEEGKRVKGFANVDQSKFFADRATARRSELKLGPKDVLVSINTNPAWVQVSPGDEAKRSAFAGDFSKRIGDHFRSNLKNNKDGALTGAVEMMAAKYPGGAKSMGEKARDVAGKVGSAAKEGMSKAREGAAKFADKAGDVMDDVKKDVAAGKKAVEGMNTSTKWILGIVVAIVALFALKGLFGGGKRREVVYQQAPQPPYMPPQPPPMGGAGQGMNQPLGYGQSRPQYPQAPMPPQPPPQGYPQQPYPQQPQQQGGGFMKGMLGGMLGGAAGAYIYDQMRNAGGQAHAGTPGHSPTPAPTGSDYGAGGDFGTDTGGDYGGGGDFGTDAGGDYGGGGDFGSDAGGDYGGGGDFGSDAGGDFGGGGDFGSDES